MASTTDEIFDDILRGINEQEVNLIKGTLWRGAATKLALAAGEKCAPIFEQLAKEISASEQELEANGVPAGVIQDAIEEFRNEARALFR